MTEAYIGHTSGETGAAVLISIKDALLTNREDGGNFVQAAMTMEDAKNFNSKLSAFIKSHQQ